MIAAAPSPSAVPNICRLSMSIDRFQPSFARKQLAQAGAGAVDQGQSLSSYYALEDAAASFPSPLVGEGGAD
ncbi:hypothetical protein, partial [Bradyrhizobium sp. Leo121]|uniref:hypothetical protein n=1 Tax=Bradyrhizobium sp. Leo121 TaxID=1571195 RepID=UPI001A91CA18